MAMFLLRLEERERYALAPGRWLHVTV